MSALGRIRRLFGDERGTTVIETALVAPVLALMALGSYDVSRMVARQHELQNGAGDMESIVLAANQGSGTDVGTIKSVIKSQLSVADNKLTVTKKYRCGSDSPLYDYGNGSYPGCSSGAHVSIYVEVAVTDSYVPMWTSFGVGTPLNYSVTRMVQVSSTVKA
jgi:Flp pilus assembly protein TadG